MLFQALVELTGSLTEEETRHAREQLTEAELIDDEPRPLTADSIPSDVASHSIDPEAARRLWALSEELLKG